MSKNDNWQFLTTWKEKKCIVKPLYRQIVEFVCKKIAQGEWSIGTKLPPQRKLAEIFGVNRSTVVTAMDELASYGIVKSYGRMGTKIVNNTWSVMMSSALDWGKYINAGAFKANNHIIQEINRLEFEPNIMRLGTGEIAPDLFPYDMWDKVLGILSRKHIKFGYLRTLGSLHLREVLAEHLKKQGMHNISADNILITSGSLQGLQLISVGLLKKGATIYMEMPTYLKSLEVFQSAGMKLRGVGLDEAGIEFWQMSSIAKEIHQRKFPIIYTIPTNHNPTGITMSLKRRRELMQFCNDNQLPIIEDAAYQELSFGSKKIIPLKAMDKTELVIYLGTASKTLAPGLRVGWLVASEAIVQRLGDIKMQMDYGTSSISQLILAEFIESGMYEKHLVNLQQKLLIRRDNALKWVKMLFAGKAKWNIPQGGFYIWITFKKYIATEKIFFAAVKENILIAPGEVYDFKHNNSLRISYSYLNCKDFAAAIRKLAAIIEKSQ
ncbi:aminotransferase-like domain-containing protein [Pectinatus sottacetonis]|uniref:aminotransferase-like domain-containing protein n=1 Tax=Pectinatus sottacetonis TaxID=1002795 RepID=UPI0018C7F413|nr:PLP-dependent aminotransferase family protein [Pectinatus sottacetonis]